MPATRGCHQQGSLLVVCSSTGGVADFASHAATAMGERGWEVRVERLEAGRWQLAEALRAGWTLRCVLRGVAVVHVEVGRLDGAPFLFALLASLCRRDLVLVAHDAPDPLLRSPANALLPPGGRWRDRFTYRLLGPLVDRRLRRMLERRVGVAVVLSDRTARDWSLADGPRRVVSVPHGAGPPTLGVPSSGQGSYVLFAGFLGPSKGVDDLVDAWAMVGADVGMPLLIAGATVGTAQQRWLGALQERSAGLPVPPRWLGAVDDERFSRLIAEAAVVVLPYREANPASGILARAMCEGRAIIATDLPTFREHLRQDEALLVVAGQPAALAEALRRCIDPELRDALGGRAGAGAATRLTWDVYGERMEQAYAIAGGRS